MKAKKILILASNYGLWAEELQAPWDALKKAGHALTLATKFGQKPLPITVSMDPDFIDPMQDALVNTAETVARTKALLEGTDWANPLKISDAKMQDYDALVIVGGPGASLDLVGNMYVHNLLIEAFQSEQLIGALCYGVGALVFARNPANNKSIIYGKTVVAHPHAWDFIADMSYPLYGASPENPGTDIVTTGFLFPLQYITEDAVGPSGKVIADASATREKPCVSFDWPFVTGLSVESSIAFGDKLVEVLARD